MHIACTQCYKKYIACFLLLPYIGACLNHTTYLSVYVNVYTATQILQFLRNDITVRHIFGCHVIYVIDRSNCKYVRVYIYMCGVYIYMQY